MTEHQCPLCHGRGRILSDKLVKYQLIMSTYSEDQLGAKGLAMGDVVIKRESYYDIMNAVKVLQTAATTTSAATNVISEVLNQ